MYSGICEIGLLALLNSYFHVVMTLLRQCVCWFDILCHSFNRYHYQLTDRWQNGWKFGSEISKWIQFNRNSCFSEKVLKKTVSVRDGNSCCGLVPNRRWIKNTNRQWVLGWWGWLLLWLSWLWLLWLLWNLSWLRQGHRHQKISNRFLFQTGIGTKRKTRCLCKRKNTGNCNDGTSYMY